MRPEQLTMLVFKNFNTINTLFIHQEPQIREQMSGLDLHVFTLKFLALKKLVFFHFFGGHKKGIMQLFSADAIVFSTKI